MMRIRALPSHRQLLAAALIATLASCSSTRQAQSAERSGFIPSDVSLREGVDGEPSWVLVNPTRSLERYDSVWIEPVQVWYGDAARRSGTSTEELERLASSLRTSLEVALQPEFQLVNGPGSRTLRMRVALTDADAAKPLGNTITTFVPQLRRAAVLGGRFLNVRIWTGAASVEGEVLDSMTGERLMAAIDRRIGTKSASGAWDRWDDVEQAFDHWSRWVGRRMAELRSAE